MHMGDNFIIDLDESTYDLVGENLHTLSGDFDSVKECKILVTDFANTSVSRVMHVDADIKYAEAMAARKFQNDGDFDEPVSVITHWKRKKGKKNAEIFCTAVPSRIYFQYLEQINGHENLVILLPVLSVLADFIGHIPHKNPIAVIFRHGRFADLVIAKKTQYYYTARYVMFDTSEEQILNLWKTIKREIETATEEQAIQMEKIIFLNWIDTGRNEPFFDNFKTDCFVFNEETIFADDDSYNISFTKALKMCSPLKGIAPGNGKIFYFADKLYPYIMVIFIILIVVMSSGYFSYHFKTKRLRQNIAATQQHIHKMRSRMTSSIPVQSNYLKSVKFIDSLFYIKHMPSYRKIINDISSGLYPSIKINDLNINYTERTIKVRLYGIIDVGFDTAYKDYEAFLANLVSDGYLIDKNNFKTDIQRSEFNLLLSWSMK